MFDEQYSLLVLSLYLHFCNKLCKEFVEIYKNAYYE